MTGPSDGCARLHARLRRSEARQATRRWGYRQRHCAKGAWPKLYRALADAERAFVLTKAELDELLAEGHALDSAGAGLQPPKRIVFVSNERAGRLPAESELTLHLSARLLVAERLALVRFP